MIVINSFKRMVEYLQYNSQTLKLNKHQKISSTTNQPNNHKIKNKSKFKKNLLKISLILTPKVRRRVHKNQIVKMILKNEMIIKIMK